MASTNANTANNNLLNVPGAANIPGAFKLLNNTNTAVEQTQSINSGLKVGGSLLLYLCYLTSLKTKAMVYFTRLKNSVAVCTV